MRVVNDYPIPGEHVVYNVDDDMDIAALQKMSDMPPTFQQVKLRKWTEKPLGAFCEAAGPKLEKLDQLVPVSGMKDAIDEAHELQTFPVYHAYDSWAPKDGSFVWNQDGLGYCWTWSATGQMMTLRACLGMTYVKLSPVSMGYLVGWANRGNYLEDMIQGMRNEGIVPLQGGETSNPEWADVDINSTSRDSGFWGRYDEFRTNFRLDDAWDLDTRSGEVRNAQECLSCLRMSLPLYVAHNWWGHAVGYECMFNDSNAPNGITYGCRNSHRNSDLIILEGTKGSPDEAIALVSCKGGDVG